MVVIFGWGAGEAKDRGEVAPVVCPNCHNGVFLHHIHSEKRVSLYFVPLVPYGSNEYLACPICRQGMQVTPGQLAAVNEMQAATALFRAGRMPEDFYRPKVEAFWRTMGVAPSGEQVLHPAPTVPPPGPSPVVPAETPEPSASSSSLARQLEDLGRLHADGVLTDEEFAVAKRRLIG